MGRCFFFGVTTQNLKKLKKKKKGGNKQLLLDPDQWVRVNEPCMTSRGWVFGGFLQAPPLRRKGAGWDPRDVGGDIHPLGHPHLQIPIGFIGFPWDERYGIFTDP